MVLKYSFRWRSYKHLDKNVQKLILYNSNFNFMNFLGVYDWEGIFMRGAHSLVIDGCLLRSALKTGLNFNWRLNNSWIIVLGQVIGESNGSYLNNCLGKFLFKRYFFKY